MNATPLARAGVRLGKYFRSRISRRRLFSLRFFVSDASRVVVCGLAHVAGAAEALPVAAVPDRAAFGDWDDVVHVGCGVTAGGTGRVLGPVPTGCPCPPSPADPAPLWGVGCPCWSLVCLAFAVVDERCAVWFGASCWCLVRHRTSLRHCCVVHCVLLVLFVVFACSLACLLRSLLPLVVVAHALLRCAVSLCCADTVERCCCTDAQSTDTTTMLLI